MKGWAESKVARRALLLSGMTILATPALAAEPPGDGQAPPAQNDPNHPAAGQEEAPIVVTAQLRSQSVQDVPVSIQVLGQQALAQQNLNTLVDVARAVPSIHVGPSGRATELYIRGIGSGINQSFDQSVGIFIDGIYHGRSRIGVAAFLDLDRVEVLKGPQSLYFGNNAIAGAFNIVSAGPGNSFEARLRALYGTHGNYAVEGAVGGPLSDTVGARIAVIASGTNGWLRNYNDGSHVASQDDLAGRITLRFAPTTDFDATIRAEGSRSRNQGLRPTQNINCPPPSPFPTGAVCGLILGGGYPTGTDNNYDIESTGQYLHLDTHQEALNLNYRIGGHTLTSITGYSGYDYKAALDADASPFDRAHAYIPENYHQFSQEVRLASPLGGRFEYLLGGYYQRDNLDFTQQITFFQVNAAVTANFPTLAPFIPIAQRIRYHQDEDSYAVFGSLTFHVTDQFQITGGIRGSWVDRSYDQAVDYGQGTQKFGGFIPLSGTLGTLPAPSTGLQLTANSIGLGVSGLRSGSRNDHAWLPSVRAQYDATRDLMLYLSYARGFKAGGFNGVDTSGVPANVPYAPEYVNAFEAGLRSQWLNHHLTFNLTLFRSNYRDLQSAVSIVTQSGSIQSVVRNAASSVSQGVELEAVVHEGGFQLHLAGTYLDAHYRSFPGVNLTAQQTFCRATYVLPFCANLANPVPQFQDLSGKPTQFAPRWSGTASASYAFALGRGWTFEPELTARYSTSYYLTALDDPYLRQHPYARVDARVTLTSPSSRWAFDLLANNLNNRKILVFGNILSGANGSFTVQNAEPRNFAAQVRFRW